MALELEVGLVLAVLGVLGCLLFLLEPSVRKRPAPWLGFFLGVLLFLFVHDLGDALRSEAPVSALYTPLFAHFLIVGFAALGAGLATLVRDVPSLRGTDGGLASLLVLAIALHAGADGIVVGATVQNLPPTEIVEPRAALLQVAHRFLEGGLLVVALRLADVSRSRTFALTLFTGLPLAATAALTVPLPLVDLAGLHMAFAFALGGVVLVVLLAAVPPLAAGDDRGALARWAVAGFLVALLAHALAH